MQSKSLEIQIIQTFFRYLDEHLGKKKLGSLQATKICRYTKNIKNKENKIPKESPTRQD
jgi:hypothetical protein